MGPQQPKEPWKPIVLHTLPNQFSVCKIGMFTQGHPFILQKAQALKTEDLGLNPGSSTWPSEAQGLPALGGGAVERR